MGKLWDAWKLGRSLSKSPRTQSFGQPMGILKCRWCRKRLKAGAEFCHHCGREQRPLEEGTELAGLSVEVVAAQLEAAGMTDRRQRLLATAKAMQMVNAGTPIDEAVAAVLPG